MKHIYHIYLDEDIEDVIERVKRELRIKEGDHVDPSNTGNYSSDE